MQLSIITPYYKAWEYTEKLAKVLEPQLNEEVEWIIVDDGCNEIRLDDLKAKVIHLENNSGGASKPRNVGLDNAKGNYIAFIDADDNVSNDYIDRILKKTYRGYDYFYIGFLIEDKPVLIINKPPKWNTCVWNTVYKRSLIGKQRFREDLVLAEDYDFNKRIRKGTHSYIYKVLYYYSNNPNSLTKRDKK